MRIAQWCKHWSCLPEAGGLYDQPYSIITRMVAAENVANAMTRYRSAQGKDIHKLGIADRRVLKVLADMGLLNG